MWILRQAFTGCFWTSTDRAGHARVPVQSTRAADTTVARTRHRVSDPHSNRPGILAMHCLPPQQRDPIHSHSVHCRWRSGVSRTDHGVVDYSLADDLGLANALPPRRLNVLTNQSAGGTHSIVVKGEGVRPIAVDLTKAGVSEVLRSVRQELGLITLGRDNETTQYDADNSAPVEQLTKDLQTLAFFGSAFWQKAVPNTEDQELLQPLLSTTATIPIPASLARCFLGRCLRLSSPAQRPVGAVRVAPALA